MGQRRLRPGDCASAIRKVYLLFAASTTSSMSPGIGWNDESKARGCHRPSRCGVVGRAHEIRAGDRGFRHAQVSATQDRIHSSDRRSQGPVVTRSARIARARRYPFPPISLRRGRADLRRSWRYRGSSPSAYDQLADLRGRQAEANYEMRWSLSIGSYHLQSAVAVGRFRRQLAVSDDDIS